MLSVVTTRGLLVVVTSLLVTIVIHLSLSYVEEVRVTFEGVTLVLIW